MNVKLLKNLSESIICIVVFYTCFHWLMVRFAGEFHTDLIGKFIRFYLVSSTLFIILEILQFYRGSSWGYLAYAFATIAIMASSFEPNLLNEMALQLMISVGALGFVICMYKWWEDRDSNHENY
ncbi:hypothetical protein ACQKPX_21350 [Photobacterium sp. DNB23_23_1]|uniref:Uncharacterized protein n=1 Tax=Photobacterium pectinilyticum TaxID=2906793 RepID=A0ABT1N436_9GAMM|nr:hypothetical protein [Photobacterium sp. ZSDE20]MCQ1059498.1 hypothetical protein [Photobacterium sp. ZSDE20]MDD1825297.1 hypothetical protein [Photobacterium sp. ZSDE20]